MELYQTIESRRSIRAFSAKPVDKPVLTKILEAANRSPSYMNTQPWEIFVATCAKKDSLAKKLLDKSLSGATPQADLPFPKEWPDDLDKRAKDHRLRRFKALGIDPSDEATIKKSFLKNFEFYGAPCVLFIGMEKALTPWSIFDLGLFTTTFLLAAQAEGLGCCTQALPMAYPDVIREELGIPTNISLILAICMGYPDTEAKINQYQSTRRDLSEFVKWLG